jgi:hypothetical protein
LGLQQNANLGEGVMKAGYQYQNTILFAALFLS